MTRQVSVLAMLVILAACGESTTTPAEQTDAEPDSTGSNEPAYLRNNVSVRASNGVGRLSLVSVGGSLRLDAHTGAIYSVELRDGSAFLQGAAVLRGAEPGWYDRNIAHGSVAMDNPGIGATLGQHMVVVTPQADALWIDDTTKIALNDANIALFEGAGAQLQHLGGVSIDSYLGPAPIDDERHQKALIQGRLMEILKNSPAIGTAWAN